jgi:hypothetical protein
MFNHNNDNSKLHSLIIKNSTDLFIIAKETYSTDSETVSIYEWGGDGVGFIPVGDVLTFENQSIISLIPSDFNYDGALDLLVQYQSVDDMSEIIRIRYKWKPYLLDQ